MLEAIASRAPIAGSRGASRSRYALPRAPTAAEIVSRAPWWRRRRRHGLSVREGGADLSRRPPGYRARRRTRAPRVREGRRRVRPTRVGARVDGGGAEARSRAPSRRASDRSARRGARGRVAGRGLERGAECGGRQCALWQHRARWPASVEVRRSRPSALMALAAAGGARPTPSAVSTEATAEDGRRALRLGADAAAMMRGAPAREARPPAVRATSAPGAAPAAHAPPRGGTDRCSGRAPPREARRARSGRRRARRQRACLRGQAQPEAARR